MRLEEEEALKGLSHYSHLFFHSMGLKISSDKHMLNQLNFFYLSQIGESGPEKFGVVAVSLFYFILLCFSV